MNRGEVPLAFEVCWKENGAAIDAADPADVYGQYVEMGASLIQTDRPAMVIEYLRSIGRHD